MRIVSIISYQGIHKPEQLPGDGYLRFQLLHASPYHLLILLVHNSTPFGGIKSGKIKQLSQQRPTPFGDVPFPLVITGAYLIKIKPGQFHKGLRARELIKIRYLIRVSLSKPKAAICPVVLYSLRR